MTDATDYWGQAGDGTDSQCLTVAGTGTETCDGDGDKTFDYYHNSLSDKLHEPWRAWQHLSNAEILPGSYTGMSGPSSGTDCGWDNYCPLVGINAPEASFSGATWHLFHSYASQGWRRDNHSRNILFLGNERNLSGTGWPSLWSGMALTSKQMKRLDEKGDDGNPNAGYITNFNDENDVGIYNPDCTVLSSGELVYNLSFTTVACNAIIDI